VAIAVFHTGNRWQLSELVAKPLSRVYSIIVTLFLLLLFFLFDES
jgi:hypothetical protein